MKYVHSSSIVAGIQTLVLVLSPLPYAPAGVLQDIGVDRILQADPQERQKVIAVLVESGPAVVRRIRGELAEGEAAADVRRRVEELLQAVRAELLGVPTAAIEKLDRVGVYPKRPWREGENAFLLEMLGKAARRSDFARAEVMRAFLRRYQALATLPRNVRLNYKTEVNPYEICRRMLAEPVGPELATVLDEHYHVLLYHDWIGHIFGMQRLAVEFVESPSISREFYELLRDKYIQTILSEHQSSRGGRMYRADGEPGQPSAEFTLRRDAPEDWPPLTAPLLLPLWRSAVATPADRDQIFKALCEAPLRASLAALQRGHHSKRFALLLRAHVLPDDKVREAVDFFTREWDQPARKGFIMRAIRPIIEISPLGRVRRSGDRWPEFEQWWNGGGREGPWLVPLERPRVLVVYHLVDNEVGKPGIRLLTAQLQVEPGKTARHEADTEFGRTTCSARAWRLPGEENTLLVSWQGQIVRPQEYPYGELSVVQPSERLGDRVGNGLAFSHGFANLGSRAPFSFLFIDTADALSPPKEPDLDWAFDEYCRRFPPGQLPSGWGAFPDKSWDFLPLEYRLRIAENYFDGLDPPERIRQSGPWHRTLRILHFLAKHGRSVGIEYLRRCLDGKWRGSDEMTKTLRDCEALLKVASTASGSAPDLLGLILDPQTRGKALKDLLRAERLQALSDVKKTQLTKGIVSKGLASETDPGRRWQLIHALRSLTGENFGYLPFGDAAKQQAAVQAWTKWAQQQP